jgi:hypothetical protein
MLPVQEDLKSASTEAQVLRQLSAFIEDLRRCCVDSILPQRFSGLAAGSGDEVRAWAQRLAQGGKDTYGLGAAGRYWIDEVRDAFAAAAKRLDEISATGKIPASGVFSDMARRQIRRTA